MRASSLALILSVISCCLCHPSANNAVARESIAPIPSAPPTPGPIAQETPTGRQDQKRHSKHVHDFFKLYGWLKPNTQIPDKDLPKAIRKIQRMLKEPETGVFNERMENLMSRPRCGTEEPYNATSAESSGDLHKRYVLWGPKWDHSPVTYRFINYTADLPAERQRTIVSAAFAQWMEFIPLNIIPASSSAQRADIHLRFVPLGPSDVRYGYTNMIADGLSMSSGLINITFNDDYPWSDDRLFNFTAVHEIGHALGMSHSSVEPAVMFAVYEGIIRSLHPDDKMGIHTAYGWKNPRWKLVDSDTSIRDIVYVSSPGTQPTGQDGLYQRRSNGQIMWLSPSGTWTMVDSNKDTLQIAGAGGALYQRHSDGSTYRYTGLNQNWQYIGLASDNVIDIVAASDQVYQRRKDGWVARWSGGGTSWLTIEQPSYTNSKKIAVTDSKILWNLLSNGDLVRSYWPYDSGSWQIVDQNPANLDIAAGGDEFYKLQSDGLVIWLNMKEYYWQIIERVGSVGIHAVGDFLYSRHGDGSIWRWTGTPDIWEELDDRIDSVTMVGDRKGNVWELTNSGDILRLVS